MGHRQVPNPWRRFGSLKTLYEVGGWEMTKEKPLRLIKVCLFKMRCMCNSSCLFNV